MFCFYSLTPLSFLIDQGKDGENEFAVCFVSFWGAVAISLSVDVFTDAYLSVRAHTHTHVIYA